MIPGKLIKAPVEEGVGVMPETTPLGTFLGCQATTRLRSLFQADRFQPGVSCIGLQDQAVMSAPQENAIVGLGHEVNILLSWFPSARPILDH
jgi:hypothetical protein